MIDGEYNNKFLKEYYKKKEEENQEYKLNPYPMIGAMMVLLALMVASVKVYNYKYSQVQIEKLKEYLTDDELKYLEDHNYKIDTEFLINVIKRVESENQIDEISLNEITDKPKTYSLINTQNGVNYWKVL